MDINEVDEVEEELSTVTSSQWRVKTLSSLDNSSKLFVQYEDYHLHLIQRKVTPPIRPTIPTTLHERLSYYRNYVSSPSKTQIFCMQHTNFTRFFWNYILNVFLKSLPHTFVHMFLASYVPEEHLFIPKMVPLFHGSKFASVLAAISELLAYIDKCIILAVYASRGLFHKNPWNRCPSSMPDHRNCYGIRDFTYKVKNSTWHYFKGYYVTQDGEFYQFVQLEYLRYYRRTVTKMQILLYFVLFCLLATMFQKHVYKRGFWKTLNVIQWSVMIVDFISFIYLVFAYFNEPNIAKPSLVDPATELLWEADIDMLAESMTTPPVLHIITARSTQEIRPSRDSTIVILSNAFLYIFKGLLVSRMKSHCESFLGVPIQADHLSWFYMWPLFFSTFYLGDLFTLGYLFLNLVLEFLTITATYNCFVEIVIWEWTYVKRWMITIAMLLVGTPVLYLTTISVSDSHKEFHFVCKVIVTFAEVLILYFMYPLDRLVDDITFHCGASPTRLRILSLRLVPIFYCVKTYILMDNMMKMFNRYKIKAVKYCIFYGIFVVIPYILGMLYISCLYLIKKKMSWKRIFTPHEEWGPSDFTTRQLRKRYDSRNYIGSQAPRQLSRYLIGKAESKAYNLDINYGAQRSSNFNTKLSN